MPLGVIAVADLLEKTADEAMYAVERPRAPAPHYPPASPARSAYGPRFGPVVQLLEHARELTPEQIECLAMTSTSNSHAATYAEAMLAARQAAERSGRAAATGLAADEATRIVVTIAQVSRPSWVADRVQWSILGQRAAWGAADAALALVVGDLLPESQLRTLTGAWEGIG